MSDRGAEDKRGKREKSRRSRALERAAPEESTSRLGQGNRDKTMAAEKVVIDASNRKAKWFFDERFSDKAVRLRDHDIGEKRGKT
jgi:hypothetical protein